MTNDRESRLCSKGIDRGESFVSSWINSTRNASPTEITDINDDDAARED
jgi:hypothetical protein